MSSSPTCYDEKLAVRAGGLELKNPIIVEAAGYIVDTWSMKRMIKTGASAVVTKTTTIHPQGGWPRKWEWNPRPRNFWNPMDGQIQTATFPEDPGFMSGMDGTESLLNPGYKRMQRFIRESMDLAKKEQCHIVASFSPRSIEEGVMMAREYEETGVSALHMDLCCPSAAKFRPKQLPGLGYEKLGCLWSEDVKETVELVKAIKNAVSIPVWPKVTLAEWFAADPNKVIQFNDSNADAFPFLMYSISDMMWIDVYRGRPISPSPYPPLPVLVPLTVGTTARISKVATRDLIPSGGVSTTTDVIQLLMAGASAIGVCRVFYKDMDACKKICQGLEYYIASQALNNIGDIKGTALQYVDYPPKGRLAEEYERGAFPIPVPSIEDDHGSEKVVQSTTTKGQSPPKLPLIKNKQPE